MKCTPQKTITSPSAGRRLAREPERVADVVGDVLDLGHLVVVREDHRVALGRQRAHLVLQRGDLLGASAPRAPGLRREPSAASGAIGRGFMAADLQDQRQVERGRRVRQRAHRDPFYPRLRALPGASRSVTPPLASSCGAPGDLRDRRAQLVDVHVVEQQPRRARPRAPRRSRRGRAPRPRACRPARARPRARARPPAAIPPAAAMWFSLIRIAS